MSHTDRETLKYSWNWTCCREREGECVCEKEKSVLSKYAITF